LILKTDKLCADTLSRVTEKVFSTKPRIVSSLADLPSIARETPIDLLLIGTSIPEGDVLDFLASKPSKYRPFRRVLVVTRHHEQHLLLSLKSLQVDGVFDAGTEGPDRFEHALKTISNGQRYWSQSLREVYCRDDREVDCARRLLTPLEQVVFAIVGDGCDDNNASWQLGLTSKTIQSVRCSLHRKLKVRHKGELIRLAAQYGYVRFMPEGVSRPGFSMLLGARQVRPRSKSDKPPAIVIA
jgi:DNA-binding NarL/FixJ family response regulator